MRGTMVVLRHVFGEEFRVTLGTYETPEIVAEQAAGETDPLISHVALDPQPLRRWSLPWWRRQLTRWVSRPPETYSMLRRAVCGRIACAMQIGGDNYTLDYGKPTRFMQLDNYLRQQGTPVVLWGASVGPFEADPTFATEMYAHLPHDDGDLRAEIRFVRIPRATPCRLQPLPDVGPGFCNGPAEPPPEKIGCVVPPGAIGLNLSPLMAKYVTAADLAAWVTLTQTLYKPLWAPLTSTYYWFLT